MPKAEPLESAEDFMERCYRRIESAFDWRDGVTSAHKTNIKDAQARDLAVVRAVLVYLTGTEVDDAEAQPHLAAITLRAASGGKANPSS